MAKRLTKAERARRERAIAARAATLGSEKTGRATSPAASAPPGPTRTRSSTASADTAAKAERPTAARRGGGDRQAARVGVGSELAERIAWSMLAGLAAIAGAGLALAIGSALLPALCPGGDGQCGVGWMILFGMAGYLLALLPACAIGGLGIWFWVAYVAGFGPMMALAAIGEWWWWTILAVLPAVAGVASSPFGRLERSLAHRVTLTVLAVAGAGFAIWWYLYAP